MSEHVHDWQAAGIVKEEEISYSPVSAMDHNVRTISLAVQSCSCGAIRKTVVSTGPWRWLNR